MQAYLFSTTLNIVYISSKTQFDYNYILNLENGKLIRNCIRGVYQSVYV